MIDMPRFFPARSTRIVDFGSAPLWNETRVQRGVRRAIGKLRPASSSIPNAAASQATMDPAGTGAGGGAAPTTNATESAPKLNE